MAVTEWKTGKTPQGGVAALITYLDAQGEPVDKEFAVQVRILELDKKGEIINTVSGTLSSERG